MLSGRSYVKEIFESADKLQFRNKSLLHPSQEIFFINRGIIGLQAVIDGEESTIQYFKRGDLIEGGALLDSDALLPGLTFQFRCIGEVTVSRLDLKDFDIQNTDYIKYLQLQNKLLATRLAGMSYKDVRRRLIARLAILVNRFGRSSNDQTTINIPLTHKQIAQSVSSTRETVNKSIRLLSQQGLLSMKGRTISITSVAKLKKELFKT